MILEFKPYITQRGRNYYHSKRGRNYYHSKRGRNYYHSKVRDLTSRINKLKHKIVEYQIRLEELNIMYKVN